MNADLAGNRRNAFIGTWRIVSAEITRNGRTEQAFGDKPAGMLSFTPDMHFVEVLMDSDVPRFASNDIGAGTDEENRNAVVRTIGIAGSYTVDEAGDFTGDVVEACTFPNWVGDVRTRKEIRAAVEGDRLIEEFHQPAGAVIKLIWRRVS